MCEFTVRLTVGNSSARHGARGCASTTQGGARRPVIVNGPAVLLAASGGVARQARGQFCPSHTSRHTVRLRNRHVRVQAHACDGQSEGIHSQVKLERRVFSESRQILDSTGRRNASVGSG